MTKHAGLEGVKSAPHYAASAQAPWCVVHPVASQDQAVMAEMRAMVLPNKGKLRGTAARAAFDGIIGHTSAPPGVTFRQDTIGGLTGWWCEPVVALTNALAEYASLADLPPIRVHVGDDEVLLDDSLRYVQRSVAAGVDATVDVWQGMPHGFVGKVGRVEASAEALKAIGTFLSARFATHLL